MSPHIVFVAPFGLRQKTTVWARTLPLARELVRLGHTADIIIPPWDSPEDAGKTMVEDGVPLVNVALGGGIVGTVRRMLGEIDRREPDIVHIVKPRAHAGLVQWWLYQRGRADQALVLDVDDWEQAWAPINGYAWPVTRFLAWQEEWGMRHAMAVTAASRWLEARVQGYSPGTPVLYLPNGVTPPRANDPSDDQSTAAESMEVGQPLVLFYSRFVEAEPNWLARFWTAVLAAVPDARLAVAGGALQPGREKEYRQTVARLAPGPSERMDWLGFVDEATQAQLYARATCAVFPAQPVPLQEAKCSVRLATTLLNGVAVVASAVGEQQHYGGDGAARLVPPNATPEVFADATIDLINSPQARTAMIERARNRLHSTYDWARLGRKLADFYGELCEGSSTGV